MFRMNPGTLVVSIALSVALLSCGAFRPLIPPPASQVLLIEPRDGDEVSSTQPTLSWKDPGGAIGYEVRVVELSATQHPADALAKNQAVLEASTSATYFLFSKQTPPLIAGRAYAWQVAASTLNGDILSRAAYFRVRFPDQTVSRRDAISIIIHRLIVPPTLSHPVVAYLGRNLLQPGDVVWPDDEPIQRREITSFTWFSWINDDPHAFFAHGTRYIFIDAVTGDVEVVPAEWWPILNDEPLWMSDAEWNDLELVIYSELHPEEVK